MSRLPTPGDDANVWGDILNDFLAVSHMDDGTIRVSALPEPQVADGSITPKKLSQAYIPTTQKGAYNGVATLDNTGRVPLAQMPSGSVLTDASTLNKGVVRLAGDLSGTADAPTVPALNSKYVKPPTGIPETDLSSDVQTKLNTGGAIGDASTTTKGLVKLAGDLAGTADAPTVPGLNSRIPLSQKGANNGVATLDSTGRVPTSQLPAGLEPDATTTTKGIIRLGGDLAGTADAPTVPGKANDSEVMHLMGNETVTGVKIFTSSPEVPIPEQPNDATSKQYVDGLIASGGVADASTTTKGILQLAGDLGGTADAPTVPTKISLTEKGANNGVATLDSTGKIPAAQLPTVGRIQPFSSSGLLMAEAGTHRLYNDSASPWTILSVRASVGVAPTGAAVIIDINVDGTTIFTTQANRPTIADGGYTSGKKTNMTVTTVPVGSYLTVDIDQVGSTTPGSDLTVQLEVV
jgi:hypothetical protein